MEQIQNPNTESREINFRDQVFQYLRHWPWFIFSVIIALVAAFVYLRYAPPIFRTDATIMIKDDANRSISELAVFQDLGVTGGLNPSSFENEIQILKSNSLTERVVRKLDLNIKYYSEGNLRSTEYFHDSPITVVTITAEDSLVFPSEPFYVQPISETKYELWTEEDNEKKEFNFGEIVTLPIGDIQITSRLQNVRVPGHPVKVIISNIPQTVAQYRNNLQVEQLSKMSSVIQLTLNASNRGKSEAILNEFIEQYNEDAINDRSLVARNTDAFIQGRLEIISEELDSVETGKVEFKQSHKLTDLQTEGLLALQTETDFTKQLLALEVELEVVEMTTEYVRNAGVSDLLPSSLGVEQGGVAAAIHNYNQVVLERSRLLASSTERNPSVVVLDKQIQELKQNVLEGLRSAKATLEVKRNDMLVQEGRIGSKISAAPSKEKVFRSISRQQELKETLYLYLLQKREENAISMAVTAPKAKVVDYAYSSLIPVSPKREMILLMSLILGLILPFVVIYVKNLLDNRIRSKFHIEQSNITAPVVGEIPKLEKKASELVQKNDRSIMAESFRILSTNLQYLFVGRSEEANKGRVVMVTSTIKGEGKTFVSFNLGLTLANTGAKVVIVGGDLRNPQIHRYVPDSQYKNGVVEYLVHQDTEIMDYVVPSGLHENLSLVFSGTIPPNPAELWMLDRVGSMFNNLKENFDYVIIDTAPAMLVADTFLLRDYVDTTIYVARAGFTQKHLLGFAEESIRYKKMENVAFVINNVSAEDLGYGSKYGYYYGYGYGYGSGRKATLFGRLRRAFS